VVALCQGCRESLVSRPRTRCLRCAAAVPENDRGPGCPACRKFPLRFDAAWTLADYQGALRTAVLRAKRTRGEPLALALGELVAEKLGKILEDWRPHVVLPIPLHWRRRLVRGTNSADVLAAAIGRRVGVQAPRDLLRRVKGTRPQGRLHPGQRFDNVRGAFHLEEASDFQGARVMLADDILTTGATASAGAQAVAVAFVARSDGTTRRT